MSVTAQQRDIIESLFKAMQAGPSSAETMMALFAEDGVMIEPFSGRPVTHTGKPAVAAAFQEMWKDPPPEIALHIDRVDLDGDRVRAEWTCTSPVFPAPMKGHDLFTIRDGKIARLEITVDEGGAPPA